jgi:hypothetical protein
MYKTKVTSTQRPSRDQVSLPMKLTNLVGGATNTTSKAATIGQSNGSARFMTTLSQWFLERAQLS